MKKWQNYTALSKVKATLESLTASTAATLEPLLDNPELIDGAGDKLAGCAERLRQIAGVLRALECIELALLADDMLGLVRDAMSGPSSESAARLEKLQLLYVAAMELPAVLEGVLSGRLARWHEYSLLHNRLRKARNLALVFTPRALLANSNVDFGRLAVANPRHVATLCAKQAALYEQAKKAFQSDAPPRDEVKALRRVFRNLETLYRDFRLGTLWGLCAALADVVPEPPPDKGHPALRLLFSFSSLLRRVVQEGAPLMSQNIPDDVLGKLLDAVSRAADEGGRLDALKYWYNLDLRLCREHRRRYGDMCVGYSRKGAWIKAVRLLVNDIRLRAEEINLAVDEGRADAEYAGKCLDGLRRMAGTAAALAIPAASGPLDGCVIEHERANAGAGQCPVEALDEFFQGAARALYQSEMVLLARAEELERTVFSTAAGEGRALTGAKLNLVLEAIRSLQLVVNAIDAYALTRETPKLFESLGLLDEAHAALSAVPLEKAAAYIGGCRACIIKLHEGARADEERFRSFVHLLLNTILYLEQETLGRAFDLERLLAESDSLLERLQAAAHDAAPLTANDAAASPDGVGDEPIAAAEPDTLSTAAPAPTAESVDPDIKACFLEEAAEILAEADTHLRALQADTPDGAALAELRRAFHTLKGSGRMVQAFAVGELAWSVENLLNQVLAGSVTMTPGVLQVVGEALAALPALVEDFAEGRARAFDGVCVAPLIASVDAQLQPREAENVEFEVEEAATPNTGPLPAEESEEAVQTREAGEQLARIRRMLEDPLGVDDQGQSLNTSSFVIPVHTLRGICGSGTLAEASRAAGLLENFLQDHPYEALTPSLRQVLADFCAGASAQLDGTAGNGWTAELRQALERLEEPSAGLPSEAASVLLRGFLQEARATNALILKLFNDYRDRHEAALALRLREQLNLFEGAARLAEQDGIAGLCHALAIAYARLGEGAAEADMEISAQLEHCHTVLDKTLNLIEKEERAPAADTLIDELNSLLAAKAEHKREREARDAEEKVEDSLATVFLEEADELLRELDANIADWKLAPADALLRDNLLRLLHTLKGSASLVGEKELSECAHDFESAVIAARNGGAFDKDFFHEAEARLSNLQELYAGYRAERDALRAPLANEAAAQLEAGAEEAGIQPMLTLVKPSPAKPEAEPATATNPQSAPIRPPVIDGTAASVAPQESAAVDEQVRVSSNLLKSLLNDANEISISQTRIEQELGEVNGILSDMDETLNRLQTYIRNFETQAREKHVLSLRSVERQEEESDFRKDFDALEMDRYTELQQISLSLLEDYDDLQDIRRNILGRLKGLDTILTEQQRTANKLQDGLIASQMVPFAGIVPRLRRLCRQVSGELGKKVNISFSNPEGKMDRNVLQAILSPLEHMIRNAIDHGVEPAAERARSGKPEEAEIRIELYRQRANIILDVSDDGRGINFSSIRKKAVEKGLLAPDARVTDQEASQLIFRPGFSTADTVSAISGRGVGLDVVNSEIRQIGGEIEVHSTPWAGTTFRIRLPLTSSLNRTLLFTLGDAEYVVLLNTIDGIMLEKVERLRAHYAGGKAAQMEYGGRQYSLVYMGTLLDPGAAPVFDKGKQSAPLLLISGSERNIALQVDAIVGSKNLVVKSLGPQFAAIPGLSGGVILGDGKVVIVLDPISLADNFAVENGALVQTPESKEAMPAPAREARPTTVLVVDDSITVRKVTSAILKRNGMNVILAKNGMEAVEILQNETPDVMLLDIEMPRMDGFEVASYIRRQHGALKDLPIIMITSRIGDKHRSRAEEIGVNEYMCKPFQEENLLAAIAGYS